MEPTQPTTRHDDDNTTTTTTTHARAAAAAAAALARSLARARGGGGGGWALGASARPTSSPRVARVIAVFRSPRARPARARCSGGGARSLARLRARGVAVVMAVAVGHAARDARNARRASRIPCARHHRASRASSPPPSPMSTMRARGVRSLAHLLLRTSPRRTPHVRA